MKFQTAVVALALCLSLIALLSSCPQSSAQTPTCGSGYFPVEVGQTYDFHCIGGGWAGANQVVEEFLPDGWIRCASGWCINLNYVEFVVPKS